MLKELFDITKDYLVDLGDVLMGEDPKTKKQSAQKRKYVSTHKRTSEPYTIKERMELATMYYTYCREATEGGNVPKLADFVEIANKEFNKNYTISGYRHILFNQMKLPTTKQMREKYAN